MAAGAPQIPALACSLAILLSFGPGVAFLTPAPALALPQSEANASPPAAFAAGFGPPAPSGLGDATDEFGGAVTPETPAGTEVK